jgi:hypothetical protein
VKLSLFQKVFIDIGNLDFFVGRRAQRGRDIEHRIVVENWRSRIAR